MVMLLWKSGGGRLTTKLPFQEEYNLLLFFQHLKDPQGGDFCTGYKPLAQAGEEDWINLTLSFPFLGFLSC